MRREDDLSSSEYGLQTSETTSSPDSSERELPLPLRPPLVFRRAEAIAQPQPQPQLQPQPQMQRTSLTSRVQSLRLDLELQRPERSTTRLGAFSTAPERAPAPAAAPGPEAGTGTAPRFVYPLPESLRLMDSDEFRLSCVVFAVPMPSASPLRDDLWLHDEQRVHEGADLQISYEPRTGQCDLCLNEVFISDSVQCTCLPSSNHYGLFLLNVIEYRYSNRHFGKNS